MSKSIVGDRVKVIAEMARQNLSGEELAQKAGVGRSAVIKMRKGQPVWRTTAGHVANALGVSVEYTIRLKTGFLHDELHAAKLVFLMPL